MSDHPQSGLAGSLRQLGTTVLGILQTRLALVGVELEEALQGFFVTMAVALAMMLFATLGLLAFTMLMVVAFWDTHRVLALALLSFAYLALAAYFGLRLRRALAERPPLLEASLAELEKDRAALRADDAFSESSARVPAESARDGARDSV